ncbi:alpha/beta hydrolase [Elioraea rosea]|uniref:alpha/beta hydrolase n=1 Tax=Elioraea rosea TaxID=2492390 RepID=UPI0013150803|nr:alpha/beta hydrolase [Elioraea rosea]
MAEPDLAFGYLEKQYATVPMVPDYPAIAARWAKASAEAVLRHKPVSLAYGTGERRMVDVFRPEGVAEPPVLFFIHGGYWQRRHRRDFAFIVEPWLASGIAVAMPGYPLCPEVSLAALIEDVKTATVTLWREAPALGLSRRWLVGGHSAGGHLAATLMATDWAVRGAHDLAFAGCLPSSGVFDLPPLLGTTLNVALGLDLPEASRLSALYLSPPRGARVIAAVGGAESAEFLRQSQGLARRWTRAGAEAAALELPGRNHFTVQDAWAEPEGALFAAALGLLGR